MVEVSALDRAHYEAIRANVVEFLQRHAANYDRPDARVLDVAPQDHAGAGPAFVRSAVETLDLDPASGATYIADLCRCNEALIPDGSFDVVVCTEVLEHVAQPFDAVAEIRRVLKPAGVALVTTPFNFRIHGPLPDCWRFSEHGLRRLFERFEIVELVALETPGRDLMPIQYSLVARR